MQNRRFVLYTEDVEVESHNKEFSRMCLNGSLVIVQTNASFMSFIHSHSVSPKVSQMEATLEEGGKKVGAI